MRSIEDIRLSPIQIQTKLYSDVDNVRQTFSEEDCYIRLVNVQDNQLSLRKNVTLELVNVRDNQLSIRKNVTLDSTLFFILMIFSETEVLLVPDLLYQEKLYITTTSETNYT